MTNTWKDYGGEIRDVRVEQKSAGSTSTKTPYHPPAEKEFISAMQAIAAKFGKLADNDKNGIWVGYVPKADNDNYSIGVRCANCAHYQSENVCKIIKAKIEPGGYCRLAAIPSERINKKGNNK